MQRLSVIPDITSLLAEALTDFGEHLQQTQTTQAHYDRIISSIHPVVGDRRGKSVMSGIDRITDKAYEIAMDGWGKPNEATTAHWYSQALNEKIKADIAENRRVPILMLDDMGDGDELYLSGSLVYAAWTFAMLAIHSDMAREATQDEIDQMLSDAERSASNVAQATSSPNLPLLRKAGLIHARRLAA